MGQNLSLFFFPKLHLYYTHKGDDKWLSGEGCYMRGGKPWKYGFLCAPVNREASVAPVDREASVAPKIYNLETEGYCCLKEIINIFLFRDRSWYIPSFWV